MQAFALEQDMQSPISKPPSLRRQLFQTVPQSCIRWSLGYPAIDTWIDTSQGTRPFLIVSLLLRGPGRSIASRTGPQKFFPSIYLGVDTSIICSASNFLSLALSAPSVRRFHAALFGTPLIKCRIADAMPAAKLLCAEL